MGTGGAGWGGRMTVGLFVFYLLRGDEEIKYTYTGGAVLSLDSDNARPRGAPRALNAL